MGFRFDRMLTCIVAAAWATALLSLGCFTAVSKANENRTQYVKKGRALFVQYCVSCHGAGGKGDGPASPALKTPPADLTNIAQKYNGFPSEKIGTWIDGVKATTAHGSREMPVWGKRFSDERRGGEAVALGEVYALSKYLESIQKK